MYDNGESFERMNKGKESYRTPYADDWENVMGNEADAEREEWARVMGEETKNEKNPWENVDMLEEGNLHEVLDEDQEGGENDLDQSAESEEDKRKKELKFVQGNKEVARNASDAMSGAEKMTEYGLDTACRIYGLDKVLKSIVETDATDADSNNPIGAVYERIEPNPESRVQLFKEIQRDSAEDKDQDLDYDASAQRSKIAVDVNGDFYSNNQEQLGDNEIVYAIQSMKKLVEELETNPDFAKIREEASKQGKSIIEYLTQDESNPTLSSLFRDIAGGAEVNDAESVIEEVRRAQDEIIENNQGNPEL